MLLNIYPDYKTLADQVANEIIAAVRNKAGATLCLAAGDTPRHAYAAVAEKATAGGVDFSRCTFIGLDEWLGIAPSNEGSCHYFLDRNLFTPLGIKPSQVHLFDALSANPESECRKMDDIIRGRGGIDLIIVGVGMNGHIGFNEPGVPVQRYSHVADLDATTTSVGQKYFPEKTSLHKGITLGLQHFLESRTAILMASGSKKAEVIKNALEGPVTPSMPASIVQKHPRARVMLDEEAAAWLSRT